MRSKTRTLVLSLYTSYLTHVYKDTSHKYTLTHKDNYLSQQNQTGGFHLVLRRKLNTFTVSLPSLLLQFSQLFRLAVVQEVGRAFTNHLNSGIGSIPGHLPILYVDESLGKTMNPTLPPVCEWEAVSQKRLCRCRLFTYCTIVSLAWSFTSFLQIPFHCTATRVSVSSYSHFYSLLICSHKHMTELLCRHSYTFPGW